MKIIFLLCSLSLINCFPGSQTRYYFVKKSIFLSGIDNPAPSRSKGLLVSGWSEFIEPKYKINKNNLIDTSYSQAIYNSNSSGEFKTDTAFDTAIVTSSVPQLRIGTDIGFALDSTFSIGVSLLINKNFSSLPISENVQEQFTSNNFVFGLWGSINNIFSLSVLNLNTRLTLKTFFANDNFYTYSSKDTIMPDTTESNYSLAFRPSLSLMIPVNEQLGINTGISSAIKIQTLDINTEGSSSSNQYDGSIFYAGITYTPFSSISITPYFETLIYSFRKEAIPFMGVSISYLFASKKKTGIALSEF